MYRTGNFSFTCAFDPTYKYMALKIDEEVKGLLITRLHVKIPSGPNTGGRNRAPDVSDSQHLDPRLFGPLIASPCRA